MAVQLVRDPMYQQLNAALRELAEGLVAGAKFLSEREVCRRFQVSRATANKAVSALVVEGVLRLRRGVGTFVTADAMDYDLRSLVSFTQKARAAGRKATTRVLHVMTMAAAAAGERVQTALGAGPDDPLRYVERVRLADGIPLILERRHIVARHCARLSRRDLQGSLYELWTDRDGLRIAGTVETIHAVTISAAAARVLDVRRGAAGLLVVATGYLGSDEPLWCERTLYRGDAYVFRNRIGRVPAQRPAVGTLIDSVADGVDR